MNLTGPQSDRDRLLSGRWDGNRQALGREGDPSDGEIARLRNENENLRNQLTRSLRELKAYQIKYPSPYVPQPEDEDELRAWANIPEIMTPLLDAYDARIAELEDTIKQQNFNLQTFKERTESLVRENDELRTANLDHLRHADLSSASALPRGAEEVLAQLQAQVQLLMDENALLVEQKVHLSQELDKQQELLEKQLNDLSLTKAKLSQTQNELTAEREHLSETERERNAAAQEALSLSEALGKNEQEIESLRESLTLTRTKLKEKERELNDLKKVLDSLSLKYQSESDVTIDRVREIEKRVQEMQSLLFTKNNELENANDLIRKLRGEYQTTRKDAEGMLQVMGGLERQIQEYAQREESVNKQSALSREKIQEALTVREQANAKVAQCENEVARLQAERKQMLLDRQNDIDRAVEKVRQQMSEKIASYERQLEEMSKARADLIVEAERSAREAKSTRDLFDSLSVTYTERTTQAQETIQRLSDELKTLSREREREFARRTETEEQNKELRVVIDRERVELDYAKRLLAQFNRQKDSENHELKELHKTALNECNEVKRQLLRKQQEYDDYVNEQAMRERERDRKAESERELLTVRLTESERLRGEIESALTQSESRCASLVEELKEKYKAQSMSLEARLKAELDKAKILVAKNRTSEIMVNELTEEKITLARAVEEARESLRAQDEELASLRSTLSELTSQLSSSQSKREEAVYRAAKAIEELNIRGLSPMPTPSQSVYGEDAHFSPNARTLNAAPTLSPLVR